MSAKILTIGSGLIDIFITSENFKLNKEIGEMSYRSESGKMDVDSFEVHTGGGATNTAAGFARMGFEVATIVELGSDELAHLVEVDLATENVNSAYIIREKKERTGGSVIMVCPDGERMVLVHRGAASMLDPHDISEAALQATDWIHVSSLGKQFETQKKIFELAEKYGKKLSWNPGSAMLKALAEPEWQRAALPVEVLLVNKQEWEMVGTAQERLKATIPQIVITDGAVGGQVLVKDQEVVTYQTPQVTAVDNTGAGDAFAVGYVAGTIEGLPVAEAAQRGAKNAASVVQQMGAKAGLMFN